MSYDDGDQSVFDVNERAWERLENKIVWLERAVDSLARENARLKTALEQVERVFNAEQVDPMQAFVMIERVRHLISKGGDNGQESDKP